MHVHLVQHDVVSTAEFWWEFGNLDSHQASAASSGHLPCLSDFRPGYRNTFNIFIWYGKHSRDMSVNPLCLFIQKVSFIFGESKFSTPTKNVKMEQHQGARLKQEGKPSGDPILSLTRLVMVPDSLWFSIFCSAECTEHHFREAKKNSSVEK